MLDWQEEIVKRTFGEQLEKFKYRVYIKYYYCVNVKFPEVEHNFMVILENVLSLRRF